MAKRAWKIAKWIGVVLLLVVLGVGYKAWQFLSTTEVRLDDKAFAIVGGGGNTLVLDSAEGPMVVDTKFMFPASGLKKAIERETGKPVKMVINTHYHFNHTGGNPRYVGAEFVGATSTPRHMLAKMADTYGPGKPGERALPTRLVDKSLLIHFGDEDVQVRYVGRGHTDGDVVVWLPKRKLLHMGDLFFNGKYPACDPDGGGSIREWGPAIAQALALGPEKIIPGHGPICGPDNLKRFGEYMTALWESALASVKSGKTKGEAVAAFDDARFGLTSMTGITSKAKNVEFAYDEAKAWVAAGH